MQSLAADPDTWMLNVRVSKMGTMLLTEDVRNPLLMFGAGGLLDSDAANLSSQTGLGVDVEVARPLLANFGWPL